MILKKRKKSVQLKTMLSLSRRGNLLNPQENYTGHLMKGLDGEYVFDDLMKELKCECLILNDLLLKQNGQTFQIDTLIISSKGITIYEIKNFEGDYIFSKDKLRIASTNKEISNPLLQLNRTTMLFRQLMEEQRVNFPMTSYVVFINKEFTLYELPVGTNVILPSMITPHLKRLNNERGSLNINHKKFAETLLSLHHSDNAYLSLPEYTYASLKKGAFCEECKTALEQLNGRIRKCRICGHTELATDIILRHINEFQLLFPEMNLTTSVIYEWCGELFSKKSIRSVLSKHFTLKGKLKGSYYE